MKWVVTLGSCGFSWYISELVVHSYHRTTKWLTQVTANMFNRITSLLTTVLVVTGVALAAPSSNDVESRSDVRWFNSRCLLLRLKSTLFYSIASKRQRQDLPWLQLLELHHCSDRHWHLHQLDRGPQRVEQRSVECSNPARICMHLLQVGHHFLLKVRSPITLDYQ
jgi:hypothetical protein